MPLEQASLSQAASEFGEQVRPFEARRLLPVQATHGLNMSFDYRGSSLCYNQETYSEHNMDSFDLEYMILSPSSQYDGGEEEASIPLDQDSWRPNTYCVIS
jgi:hypothetical protein